MITKNEWLLIRASLIFMLNEASTPKMQQRIMALIRKVKEK